MYSYIHIPFCESRCKYCRFSTFVENDEIKKQFYVDFLINSIKNQKIELNKKLNSIYFGGGTPTSLSSKQLESIVSSLKEKYVFSKDIEITLESTPNNISEENLEKWYKMGINRLSIGIQSLNDDALKEILRVDKKELVEKLDIIKNTKIENISLDFIIGLPYVKKGEILRDLKYVIENYSFVKHISLYMLEDYYDYPQAWQELSINDEDFLEEYISCKNYLEEKLFSRYELSNFAKKGFECKHNFAYWEHKEVIAYGLGAHSFLNGFRYAYPNTFKDYYTGKFEYEEFLEENDLFLEKVMFGLRTSGLNNDIYFRLNQNKINEFIDCKLLNFKDNLLILTDKGVTLLDYIIKEII